MRDFRSVACRLRKAVLPLATHGQYWFGTFSQLKKDVNKLERIAFHQSTAARGLKHTSCEEGLRKTVLFHLVRRWLIDDLMVAYN